MIYAIVKLCRIPAHMTLLGGAQGSANKACLQETHLAIAGHRPMTTMHFVVFRLFTLYASCSSPVPVLSSSRATRLQCIMCQYDFKSCTVCIGGTLVPTYGCPQSCTSI